MAVSIETWAPPQDSRLRRMRLDGASWDVIAQALAVSAAAAMARAVAIGARRAADGPAAAEDPLREPLPAGHPCAWAVLTQGTWLAGTRYPSVGAGDLA